MNDLTEVEDEDFQLGKLEPIAAILTALGCQAAVVSENGVQILLSSSAGYDFHICTPSNLADRFSLYVFIAKFRDSGFRFTLRDANAWNCLPVGAVATLDEHGDPQLTYSVLRNELSAKSFAQHLVLWFFYVSCVRR